LPSAELLQGVQVLTGVLTSLTTSFSC